MIPHSRLFEEASRYSYTMSTRVDVYNAGALVYENLPISGGSVKSDRTKKVRWTASLELAAEQWTTFSLLSKDVSRMKVYQGITSIGKTEVLQLGEYRLDDMKRSQTGNISLSCSGLESYLLDSRFVRPVQPFYGMSTVEAIRLLVTEGIPGMASSKMVARNTKDKLVTDRAPWARDRRDIIDKLAESIEAEFYVDATGTPTLVDIPDLTKNVPVYLVNEGPGGVLVGQDIGTTRDKVYNAVSVTGNKGEVWAVAVDNNPASPTYFYGPFGQKPKFYTSQYLYTNEQCQAVADKRLAESKAASRPLSFTAAPINFLEAGDVTWVRLEDKTLEKHLLQSTSLGLGVSGTLSAETYSVEDDSEGSIG